MNEYEAILTELGIDPKYWQVLKDAPSDIRGEILELNESIELLNWMMKPDDVRGYAKNRPKDKLGRIIVDLEKPHVLEDMDYFRQSCLHFKKHGKYTNLYPNRHPNSDYKKFWREEKRRCWDGYVRESDGEWISGYYYWYLNYSPIDITIDILDEDGKETGRADRFVDFPAVWDSDYMYYHYVEQAEVDGEFGAILKTRGRGYSFKAAAMLARNYFLKPKSKSFAFASDSEYLEDDGLLDNKTWNVLDFIDLHTAWSKGRLTDSKLKKISGYVDPGDKKKKGFKSQIIGVTTGGNPEKGRGKRGKILLYEEGGIFPHLLKTWVIARSSLEDGSSVFGFMLAFGTGGCLTAGNKIWTSSGQFKNIEDLLPEEGIIGYNESTKSISKEPISYWQEPKTKECIKLTSNTGRTLECSLDHPIYTTVCTRDSKPNKFFFKEAENFNIGDKIAIVDKVDVFGNKKMWNPRLIGLLVGDGSYGHNCSVIMSNCDKEVNEYVESNFDCKTKKEYLTKDNKVYKELRIRGIRPELRKLGIVDQTGLDKTLPVDIHDYSKEDLSELIAGFYDADGYVGIRKNKSRNTYMAEVSLSSASESLLNEVRFILQKFGIHGTMRKRLPRKNINKKIKDKNPWYEFIISDKRSLLEFANNFELLCKHKKERLEKIKREFSNVKQHSIDKGVRLEKISSIEYVGSKRVYNLTADATNTYLGNGIITHNTPGANFEGLEELFYHGDGYRVKMMRNIFDKVKGEGKCAMFIPEYMNRKNCYDENGNSDPVKAMIEVVTDRNRIRKNATNTDALTQEKAERPFTPQEAVIRMEGSIFPVSDLKVHLEDISPRYDSFVSEHYIGDLSIGTNGDIAYKPNADAIVIREFPIKDNKNKNGAIEIFHLPVRNGMGEISRFRYIAGIDTYDDDESSTNSLGSIQIMDMLTDEIVAEFTGRPKTAAAFYDICFKMLKFYNAIGNYENDKKGLYAYFAHRHALSYLCDVPEILKDMDMIKGINLGGNKAHPYSEKVYTPEGIKKWEDIEIGSELYGTYGNITRVIDIPFDGITDVYEVKLKDGRGIKASSEHLWEVIDSHGKKVIKTTLELKTNLNRIKHVKGKEYKESNYYIPKNKGVNYRRKKTKIDPYLLGLMLGDGCFTNSKHHNADFSSNLEDLETYKNILDYEIYTKDDRHHSIRVKNIGKNLKELNLHDKKSRTKFIPDIYKYNSKKTRLNIIKGLMDTDGCIGYGGNPEYCSVSKFLADDIIEIARSLGINCNINNFKNEFGKVYVVRFYTDVPLFNLERKYSKQKITKNRAFKTAIVNIKLTNKEHSKCVTVDAKDNCYLIGDFVTTHNSKGTNSNKKVNAWGRRLQADWMLAPVEEREEEGIIQLQRIRSIAYLKEAIGYNEDGNFDRVSSAGMMFILREEYKKYVYHIKDEYANDFKPGLAEDPFFNVNFKKPGEEEKEYETNFNNVLNLNEII